MQDISDANYLLKMISSSYVQFPVHSSPLLSGASGKVTNVRCPLQQKYFRHIK